MNVKKEKIQILDYDSDWAKQFEILKNALATYLKDEIIKIEHVGSTSIPGMKAKPIIDLDIIFDNDLVLDKIISKLKKLGYIHLGNLGITGREAFKRKDATTPNFGAKNIWFKHHLYLCKKGSVGLTNHLNLRNYLIENPKKVIEYSNLKQQLANKYPYDMDSYIDGKTDFILDILSKTGMNSNDTRRIEKQNKLNGDSK